MRILISLVSDQAAPNLLLAKELAPVDRHILISTGQMVRKAKFLQSVFRAEPVQIIELSDPHDYENIKTELSRICFPAGSDVIVNLTCGTKIMFLAAYEVFNAKACRCVYIEGNKYYDFFDKHTYSIDQKIELNEYLSAYGITLSGGELFSSGLDLCRHMLSEKKQLQGPIFEYIRNNGRDKKIDTKPEMRTYLEDIGFKPENAAKLSKYEARFITGGWLEEYLYWTLREILSVDKPFISCGAKIRIDDVANECDVLLMYRNQLYVFECKSSTLLSPNHTSKICTQQPDASECKSSANRNIFTDTAYKAAALGQKFGLMMKSVLVIADSPIQESNRDRAKAFRITLIDNFDDDSFRCQLKERLNLGL